MRPARNEKHGLSERERNSAPSHVSRYGYELAVVGVDGTQLRRLTANRAFGQLSVVVAGRYADRVSHGPHGTVG